MSVHPDGIWDFGLEASYTPISLVIEHHAKAKKPRDAALWLCNQLGIDAASLGYKHPAGEPETPDHIEIARLATLKPIDFAKEAPAAAKKLGISIPDLKKLVVAERRRQIKVERANNGDAWINMTMEDREPYRQQPWQRTGWAARGSRDLRRLRLQRDELHSDADEAAVEGGCRSRRSPGDRR